MMRRSDTTRWVIGACLGAVFFSAIPAQAILDQDTRTLIRASEFGLLGGTAAGLIMWPLSGQLRTVFIGTSLGLYVGIAVGIYQLVERGDLGRSSGSFEGGHEPFFAYRPELYGGEAGGAGCLGHSEAPLQDVVQARMAYLSATEAGIRLPILRF